MPRLRVIAVVVQSDEALNLKGTLTSVSLLGATAMSNRVFVDITCSTEFHATHTHAMVQTEKKSLTIVPARNESPTTDPCQPVARIQPGAQFSNRWREGLACQVDNIVPVM